MKLQVAVERHGHVGHEVEMLDSGEVAEDCSECFLIVFDFIAIFRSVDCDVEEERSRPLEGCVQVASSQGEVDLDPEMGCVQGYFSPLSADVRDIDQELDGFVRVNAEYLHENLGGKRRSIRQGI